LGKAESRHCRTFAQLAPSNPFCLLVRVLRFQVLDQSVSPNRITGENAGGYRNTLVTYELDALPISQGNEPRAITFAVSSACNANNVWLAHAHRLIDLKPSEPSLCLFRLARVVRASAAPH
jgi:hypothetical protein